MAGREFTAEMEGFWRREGEGEGCHLGDGDVSRVSASHAGETESVYLSHWGGGCERGRGRGEAGACL